MAHADLLDAIEALPTVGRIAADLAVEISSTSLALFGVCLEQLEIELRNSRIGSGDGRRLDDRTRKVLERVEEACAWPERKDTSGLSTLRALTQMRKNKQSSFSWSAWLPWSVSAYDRVRECLRRLSENKTQLQALRKDFKDATARKKEEPRDEKFKSALIFSGAAKQAPEYPARVNEDLHKVLSKHLCCCSRHRSTWLRLNPGDHVRESGVTFEFLFSAETNTIRSNATTKWRETRMVVSSKDPKKHRVTFNDDFTTAALVLDPPVEKTTEIISPRVFCEALNCSGNSLLSFQIEPPGLKQVVTKETLVRKVEAADSIPLSQAFTMHRVPRKTRIILAYTIAKSVWQYYDSNWMKLPWTREDIHLLNDRLEGDSSSSPLILCRPYFAKIFQEDESIISEYISETGLFVHRYPKVLALGILLIELAKGRPLETVRVPTSYSGDSINDCVFDAWRVVKYEGLFGEEGDDIDAYCDVVKSCLNNELFRNAQHDSREENPGRMEKDLEERRAIIYQNIVHPLKRLLIGMGYWTKRDKMKCHLDTKSTTAKDDACAISESRPPQSTHNGKNEPDRGQLDERSYLLHGKARMTSASWIAGLVSISEIFSEPIGSQSVRIAVIDTGCDLEKPIFKLPGYEDRLRGHWRDWLDESSKPQDEHGHGTEIVSLLLRILPNAEILVARVAKNQQDLDTADELIVKAINHAATEWLADIITMSFGFSHEKQSIKKAIRKAEEVRNESIVFFAAAANEGLNTEELFPANFDPVIPIRGTDCAGAFVPLYDPDVARIKHGMQLYGTLGEDVPCCWPDEGRLSSGCSIATPIAAGIAALVIQCVSSKQNPFNQEDRRKIRTRRAILEVFHEISIEKATNRRYINPRNLVDKTNRPNVAMIQHVLGRIP